MAQVNKGSRRLYHVRIPTDVAEVIEAQVAASGQSYSEFIADRLAELYGKTPPSERFVTKKARRQQGQEVLPVVAA